MDVSLPVRVYEGMPIGQLIYFPVEGNVAVKYNNKASAKYSGQPNRPVESMMWKNKSLSIHVGIAKILHH